MSNIYHYTIAAFVGINTKCIMLLLADRIDIH